MFVGICLLSGLGHWVVSWQLDIQEYLLQIGHVMSQQQFHKRIKEPSTSSELKTKYVLDNESGVDEEKQRHG